MSPNTRGSIAANASGSAMTGNRKSSGRVSYTRTTPADLLRKIFGKRLVDSVIGMNEGETRSGDLRWWHDAIAKGNQRINPLGKYPDAARECLEKGRSFSAVTAPVRETLAFLRLIAGVEPKALDVAILNEQKKQGEEDNTEMALAQCVGHPERSKVEAFVRAGREHIEALTVAVESAEAWLIKDAAR